MSLSEHAKVLAFQFCLWQTVSIMQVERKYRGRIVTQEDIEFIRRFIAANPGASRRKLSAQLCEVWQWKQANGALCDMVCRGLLLMLHRAGEIELPASPLSAHETRWLSVSGRRRC